VTAAELVQANWEAQRSGALSLRCMHVSDTDLAPWKLVRFQRPENPTKQLYYYCCANCQALLEAP
jgi:hypothetical protein